MAGFEKAIAQHSACRALEIGCGPWAPLAPRARVRPLNPDTRRNTLGSWVKIKPPEYGQGKMVQLGSKISRDRRVTSLTSTRQLELVAYPTAWCRSLFIHSMDHLEVSKREIAKPGFPQPQSLLFAVFLLTASSDLSGSSRCSGVVLFVWGVSIAEQQSVPRLCPSALQSPKDANLGGERTHGPASKQGTPVWYDFEGQLRGIQPPRGIGP